MDVNEIFKIASRIGENDEFKIKNIEDNKEYSIEQFTCSYDVVKAKRVLTLYVRGKYEWKQSGNGRLKK